MRVPQVSERIKEAPAQALRGVFAGIGQLLLITDKLRNKASHEDVPRARTPGASETVTDTAVTSPAGQGAGTTAAPAGPAAAEAAPAPVDAGLAGPAPAGPAPAGPAPADAAAAAGAAPAGADAAPAETAAAVPAEEAAAKPATTRRTAARPVTDKPVTAKPPAKPAAAKPATAKPSTPRRTAAKAAAAEAAGEAAPKPPKRQSARNFDKTGNVRVLGDEAGSPAAAAPEPAAASAEPAAASPEPVAASPEPTAAAPGLAAAATPLPNYDELSVASLRARLRNLDVAQVRQLAEYERAHAARADVLTMFERRIAKLEAEA